MMWNLIISLFVVANLLLLSVKSDELDEYATINGTSSTTNRKNNVCHISSPHYSSSEQVFTYNLEFSWGDVAPDNFQQKGVLTNGQFPGPPIIVEQYSTLIVNVINKLDKGFTLHFHGIHQHGTLSSDGVPGVTQYEIPPCGQYRYVISIGAQFGTFIYHAHTDFDLNWAFGALIINDPPEIQQHSAYKYDEEKIILLSQCFHVSTVDIVKGLRAVPFVDVPDTMSLLINGKSWGKWTTNNKFSNFSHSSPPSSSDTGYDVLRVRKGKKYRLRVIGFGIDSMLNFHIQNHRLKVIEIDGIVVVPVYLNRLQINVAQRYSVIIEANQPVDNYDVTTKMVTGPGPRNGYAILHYNGAPSTTVLRHQVRPGETDEIEVEKLSISKFYPAPNIIQRMVYPIPKKSDKQIIIESHQRFAENGQSFFDINGKFFEDYKIPVFVQLRNGVSLLNKEPIIYPILVGDLVQIVFQNTVADDNDCEQHPWHMHGHSFYIVGHGPDAYDPSKDGPIIDENIRKNRLALRDVGTLYADQTPGKPNTTKTPCGWLAIRFEAKNPGIWMVHCHLTAHQILGKRFLLYEHSPNDKLLLSTN